MTHLLKSMALIAGLTSCLASVSTFGGTIALYALANSPDDDSLLRVDPTTGIATVIGPLGFGGAGGLAYDGTENTLFAIDGQRDLLMKVDRATGFGTPVGPLGIDSIRSLTFDDTTGTLYGVAEKIERLVTIDTTTGAATPIGNPDLNDVLAIAFNKDNGTLYGFKADSGIQLITINTTTGSPTLIGPSIRRGIITGADFHPTTHALFGVDPSTNVAGTLYTIDVADGSLTSIGLLGQKFGTNALAFAPAPHVVPEPSTLAYVLLAPLFWLSRHKS